MPHRVLAGELLHELLEGGTRILALSSELGSGNEQDGPRNSRQHLKPVATSSLQTTGAALFRRTQVAQ